MKEHKLPENVVKFLLQNTRTVERIQDQLTGAISLYCTMEGISNEKWQLAPDCTKLIMPEEKKKE